MIKSERTCRHGFETKANEDVVAEEDEEVIEAEATADTAAEEHGEDTAVIEDEVDGVMVATAVDMEAAMGHIDWKGDRKHMLADIAAI